MTFDIDANGILHVSAKDKATGKEQKIRIEASSGLGDKDIERMVKEAEAHAADDKRRRDEIERRNRLDAMVYEVEKNSKEWADKLEAGLKSRLDSSVEGAKAALRSGNADEIAKALEELQQAYSAAGASLYAASRGAGAGSESAAGDAAGGPRSRRPVVPPKEGAVDADYEIVDDDKSKKNSRSLTMRVQTRDWLKFVVARRYRVRAGPGRSPRRSTCPARARRAAWASPSSRGRPVAPRRARRFPRPSRPPIWEARSRPSPST